MKLRDARNYLTWADSYSRMSRLLELRERLSSKSWLRLLGEFWSLCDNNGFFINQVLFEPPVYDRDSPILEMMTREEREELRQFPDTLHIYRGCYEDINEYGHSYTLDEDVARRFVTYGQYAREDARPMLVRAVVPKNEIVAYKNDRSEREIIIRELGCDIIDTVYLDEEPEELAPLPG